MSSLSQFTGGRKVAAIVNAFSSGGAALPIFARDGVKSLASGPLSAGALATVLSITGRGSANVIGAYAVDSTSRTIRLKVTVDGSVIFDATTGVINTSLYGLMAIGFSGNSGGSPSLPLFQPIPFRSSLLVEIASSLPETNKIETAFNYEVDV